jgi:hypothetical protein
MFAAIFVYSDNGLASHPAGIPRAHPGSQPSRLETVAPARQQDSHDVSHVVVR